MVWSYQNRANDDDWSKDLKSKFEDHLYSRFTRQAGSSLTEERKQLYRQLAFCIVEKISDRYSLTGFRHLTPAETEVLCKDLLQVCGNELHIDMKDSMPVL